MILTPLQKLPNNVGNLGKIIVANDFEWLPKVQKIAQSGHCDPKVDTPSDNIVLWLLNAGFFRQKYGSLKICHLDLVKN